MPGNGDLNNDDYVAKLLAEDAKRSSIKYATVGLSAFLPGTSRRPGPKPNTRFLSHLVRDVDSHNAALKRKEEQESRARIERYRKNEREDERARALDLARTRRRKYREDSPEGRKRSSKRRRRSSSHDSEDSRKPHRSHRQHPVPRSEDSRREDDERKSKSHAGNTSHRPPQREDHRERRERHTTRKSSSKQDDRDRTGRSQSSRASPPKYHPGHRHARSTSQHSATSDSDPLEAIVGPLPPNLKSSKGNANERPVHARGRGAHNSHLNTSSIDAHFSPGYDPSADTGIHSHGDHSDRNGDDDWDLALSALRDRTAWKNKQSERLREAGFTDEEIRKWERSSAVPGIGTGGGDDTGRDIGDVRWVKRGQDREWDVGKEKVDREQLDSELERKRSRAEGDGRSGKQDGWGRSGGGLLKRFTSALEQ